MPSTTLKQKHYMAMALAMKHGHHIAGIDKGTTAELRKTAESMTEAQLHDFQTLKKAKPHTGRGTP